MTHLPTINTFGIQSFGNTLSQNAPASATYVTANRAIYIPVRLANIFIARLLFSANGATASGNIDMGIYNDQGTRLVSIESTAQAGTNSLQSFNITDTTLLPGLYYLAVAMDNTTGTLFRVSPVARAGACAGVRTQLAAFPLPATASFTALGANYVPLIGMSNRTFL